MNWRYTLLALPLLLIACAGGIPPESSRPPAGNPNGTIVVQEFSDLQCPACRGAHVGISIPIIAQYGNVVRYEFKHFPLRTIHRYALDAAEASECAADQGKFWDYIDTAFVKQDSLNHDSLLEWAGELELDTELFERCWKSHTKRSTVLADYKEGRELTVGGTPTFFVNGQKVQTGFDTISAAIKQALGQFEQRL